MFSSLLSVVTVCARVRYTYSFGGTQHGTMGRKCIFGKPLLSSIVLNKPNPEHASREFFPSWVGVGICLLFSFFELHHTKTLANQELGHTPWPLASLSQGDLFRKALKLEALD